MERGSPSTRRSSDSLVSDTASEAENPPRRGKPQTASENSEEENTGKPTDDSDSEVQHDSGKGGSGSEGGGGGGSDDDFEDGEDSEENMEGLDPAVQLERERKKLREAKATIGNLIANIGEYKQVLESEKKNLEEQSKAMRNKYEGELQKLKQAVVSLEEEKKALLTAMEEFDQKVQTLEEDKGRRNRETMENLQTLLKEMTYIEEVNETLTKQLEAEKEKNTKTQAQLKTSAQIIEQLEFKIARQENQLKKMQQSVLDFSFLLVLFFFSFFF
jgi:hypothetical protein